MRAYTHIVKRQEEWEAVTESMPGCGEKENGKAEYRRRKEQEAKWLLGSLPQNQNVFSASSRGQQPPLGAGVTSHP